MTQSEIKSNYGVLGLDVGRFGRWSRLVWGILILIPITIGIIQDYTDSGISLTFAGLTLFWFIVIVAAYSGVYWTLGERLFATANPWINTAVLVIPAFLLAWWEFTIGPLTPIRLPMGLQLAMGIYVGISFILQWRINYGGCEVVAIPILLFKRRYVTYCIPLVAADAVEKAIIERKTSKAQ